MYIYAYLNTMLQKHAIQFFNTNDSNKIILTLSLVHTVSDISPGVATVWPPGPTGTTGRRRQAPH